VLQGETHGDHATPREPDDDRAPDPELTERVEQRIGVVLEHETRRGLALSVTGPVEDDDAPESRQRLDLPAPHPTVEEEAVEQHDRRIARTPLGSALFVEQAA
jgi:hypothetical protein